LHWALLKPITHGMHDLSGRACVSELCVHVHGRRLGTYLEFDLLLGAWGVAWTCTYTLDGMEWGVGDRLWGGNRTGLVFGMGFKFFVIAVYRSRSHPNATSELREKTCGMESASHLTETRAHRGCRDVHQPSTRVGQPSPGTLPAVGVVLDSTSPVDFQLGIPPLGSFWCLGSEGRIIKRRLPLR